MKKEIWGVNVIGRQGVNAENDFAIMANDAGDDVIVKIKDTELTGAEFATLKEIAEGGPTPGGGGFPEQDLNDPTFIPEANHYYQQKDGEQPEPESQFTDGVLYFYDGEEYHAITGEGGEGGGMPDPTDAEDGDVIKVTVTPAEYEADPKVAVGDVLTDLYAKIDVEPDFDALSYDDHRFEQSLGLPVADLIRGTCEVDGQTMYCSIVAINMAGMEQVLLMTWGEDPNQEQPNDIIYYLKAPFETEMWFDGWNTNFPIADGYANIMYEPHDQHDQLPPITVTQVANQDLWCKYIGKQKPFAKVKDEIKEAGWGKPYPAFTKANQVLTSAGESYMLMPTNKDIPLSGSGRFYFNTDLSIDQMDENLGTMVRDGMSGMELRIYNTKDESEYCLVIGGEKDEHDEYAVRYIAYSKDPGNGEDPTFSWVYATADYDIDAEGTTLHMTHGWNQEEINNCTWDGDSYTYVDAIHSDYAMILPIYGSMLTIQEGLYYGDIKNAKTEWKDLNINLESMTVDSQKMEQWSGGSSQQPVVVVYDNQGRDDKLHYMTMYNLKKEIVQLYKHRIGFAFTDNNNNAFNVRLTLINDVSSQVTIDTLDGYIASGVVSVNGVIYPETATEYETIVDMYRTGGGGFSVTAASITSGTLKFYNSLHFDTVTVNDLNDNVTELYPNLN